MFYPGNVPSPAWQQQHSGHAGTEAWVDQQQDNMPNGSMPNSWNGSHGVQNGHGFFNSDQPDDNIYGGQYEGPHAHTMANPPDVVYHQQSSYTADPRPKPARHDSKHNRNASNSLPPQNTNQPSSQRPQTTEPVKTLPPMDYIKPSLPQLPNMASLGGAFSYGTNFLNSSIWSQGSSAWGDPAPAAVSKPLDLNGFTKF